MTRAAWMTRVAGVALAALAITSANAAAQQVRQQSVRPAYDVDSAMARATLLRRQNRKAEAERVMAKAVAMAPGRADARALHEQLRQEVRGGEAMVGRRSTRHGASSFPSGERAWCRAAEHGLGPVIARVSRVDRGPLSDDRLAVEAYPAFPRGYFAFGAAHRDRRHGVCAQHRVGRGVRDRSPIGSRARWATGG